MLVLLADVVLREQDVEIECTLENEGNVESIQRSFNIIGHLFFDNPQVADVVFTFSNEAAGQRRIFASRAILEHCSEYYKNRKRPLCAVLVLSDPR